MLVVRPGFRELHLGHLAALAVAFLAAATIILLRSLAGQEKRTTMLGVLICYGVIFNGVAAAATGIALPSLEQLGLLLLVGGFRPVARSRFSRRSSIRPPIRSRRPIIRRSPGQC